MALQDPEQAMGCTVVLPGGAWVPHAIGHCKVGPLGVHIWACRAADRELPTEFVCRGDAAEEGSCAALHASALQDRLRLGLSCDSLILCAPLGFPGHCKHDLTCAGSQGSRTGICRIEQTFTTQHCPCRKGRGQSRLAAEEPLLAPELCQLAQAMSISKVPRWRAQLYRWGPSQRAQRAGLFCKAG